MTYKDVVLPREKKKKRPPQPSGVNVVEFDAAAEEYGVSQAELAGAIAASEMEYDQPFQQDYGAFEKQVIQKYGSDQLLDDPTSEMMLWEAYQQKKNMNYWRDDWVYHTGPVTVLQGVQLPELASKATSQILSMVFEMYGEQSAAVVLQTSLIEDDAQREETWRLIEELAQRDMPTYKVGGEASVVSDPYNTLARILENPEAFNEMGALQQKQAIEMAQMAIQNQERFMGSDPESLSAQMDVAQNIWMREGGWKLALDEGELKNLRSLLKQIKSKQRTDGSWEDTGFFTTDIDVSDLGGEEAGISHFRYSGNVPTFTFDPVWAQNNFAEHSAVLRWLEEKYPDAQFKYGQEGAVGKVFALLDRGTDDLSAPVGAGLEQIQELTESGRDPAAYSRYADDLEKKIKHGEVAEADMPAAVSRLMELRDYSENDAGWSGYMDSVRQRSNPSTFGTGFGDSVTNSLGVFPGDAEYANLHAVSTLVGQLIFDPTILAGGVLKGVKLAKVIPAGAKIGNSRVAQAVFDIMSKPAEALWASRRGKAWVDRVSYAVANMDESTVLAHLQQTADIDADVARRIYAAAKESPEALHETVMQWTLGRTAGRKIGQRASAKIDEAVEALEVVDVRLPKQIKSVKAKLNRRIKKQTGLERLDLPRSSVGDTVDGSIDISFIEGDVDEVLTGVASPVSSSVVQGRFKVLGKHESISGPSVELQYVDSAGRPIPIEFRDGSVWEDGRFFAPEDKFISAVPPAQGALRPVRLTGQKLDATGKSVGDLTPKDYVWVKTEDVYNNTDLKLDRSGTDVPQGSYTTSLQDDILQNGYPKPVEVAYDESTGRFFVDDGNHALEAAHQLGEEYIPVRTVSVVPSEMSTLEKTKFVPPTHPKPLTELAPDRFKGMATKLDDEVKALTDELGQLDEQLKTLKSRRADMLSEKFYWENVLRGSDWEPLTPMHRLPQPRSLRKLAPAQTKFGKVWEASIEAHRLLPHAVYKTLQLDDLARLLRKNPKIDEASMRIMETFRRWGNDTGTGQRLWFETTSLPEGALGDEAVEQTYKHIRDWGRYIGTPDEVLDRVIGDLIKASGEGKRIEVYQKFVDGYEEIVGSARRLNQAGKHSLSNMWPELSTGESMGMIRRGNGVRAKSESTLWVPAQGPNGDPFKIGIPSVEADMLQGFTLPTMGQMEDYVRLTRAHMKGWAEAGSKFKRGVAEGYFSLTGGWRAFNAMWARWVLTGKMPSALPLRIQMEQQIRIEAFGFASMVQHPSEWWKSLKGSGDRFQMFGDSPTDFLGVLTSDYLDDPIRKLAQRGIKVINIGKNPNEAMLAIAGRIKAYSASPSFRIYLEGGTNAQILEKLRANRFIWDQFEGLWDEIIAKHTASGGPLTSYEKIVGRVRTEIKQVLGEGESAKRVIDAAKTGRITVNTGDANRVINIRDQKTMAGSRRVTDDGNELADELTRMYENGEWKPGILEIPLSWGEYLPTGRGVKLGRLKRASDWMFENMYSRPDLYFGRSPLYRQIAAREYDRLVKIGFSPKRAEEMARTYGARQTADILFTIGANSSADHYLRAIMPFFPAWKELAETWLLKIPANLGGGGPVGWMIGAPGLARRFDIVADFFKDTGLVYKEGDGWRVRMGFLTPIVRGMTGLDVDTVSVSLESFTGILPAPSLTEGEKWYAGLMPKVGAPSAYILHGLNSRYGGVFDTLEENLTLFGGNQSLGPSSWDYFFAAKGWTPPWQIGQTSEVYEDRLQSATVDALRIEWAARKDSEPQKEDYKTNDQYVKAWGRWVDDLVSSAESKTNRWYVMRGLAGMTLPFSIQYETDADTELNAIREIIYGDKEDPESLTEAKKSLTTPLLESFREAHPELEQYLTGKSIELVPDDEDSEDTYEEFQDEMEHGRRINLTSDEWVIWAQGNQERAVYRARLNKIFREFGNTPQQWLLSRRETSEALDEEGKRWDRYLFQSEIIARQMDLVDEAGQPTSFKDMWEAFVEEKEVKYGQTKKLSRSFEQELAGQALNALDVLAPHFSVSGYTDSDYLKIRGVLNDVFNYKDVGSKSPVFRATSWWWEHYGLAYSDEKSVIWDKINATPSSQRGPLYRELVELENRWASKVIKHPKYGIMPSPQEVMWSRLDQRTQTVERMGWAKLPVEFLSTFQRQTTYGKSKKDPKLDELVSEIFKNEKSLETIVDTNALSYSSTEYENLRAAIDRKNLAAAEELGVVSEYQKWQQPPYKRLAQTNIIHNPFWSTIVANVDAGRRFLDSQDVSPRGSTAAGVEYQRRIVKMAEEFRAQDEDLDNFFRQLEIAYGEGADQPAVGIDMYWPLFFDGFGTAPGYLNYY